MLGPPEKRSWRLAALALVLCGSTIALILRLAQLQIAQYEEYRQQAQDEHWSRQSILAHRGRIKDATGYTLASTITVYDVFVHPNASPSPKSATNTARTLAPLLDMPAEEILGALSKPGEEAILVKAGVCYDSGKKIAELRLPGVQCVEASKRLYPEGNLGAPLLGFVGKDNWGLTGIEADFNQELAGVAGTLVFEQDSTGMPIPLGFRQMTPPKDGADLVLTIQRYIQTLVERELDKAIKKHKASGGTIIVMEPKTGAILGMASQPTFDLTKLDLRDSADMELYRNRAITDMYEPGSIFKIVTLSAALEEKKVNPQTTYQCNGRVYKYGATISTWNYAAHGQETITDLLKNSCNVGAAWVADLLGKEKLYEYIKRFGFGQPTSIGLEGESGGKVRTPTDEGWTPIDLLTNAFGQGISVTPMQMITAVSAVANGGLLMRPYVVKEAISPKERHVFEPVVVRRVISVETSRTMTDMLRQVVEEGGGKLAEVPGYHLAGKTGTADIPQAGGYTSKGTIAGFVGYGPVEDPRFAILVKIDQPKDTPWAGEVAAPIFKSIAQQLLTYMKIPPASAAVAQQRN